MSLVSPRFVPPEEFAELKDETLALGFRAVAAGPFVRSSYQAETLYREALAGRGEHGAPRTDER